MIFNILDVLYLVILICTAAIFFIIGRAWEYANPTIKRKDQENK